MIVAWVEEWWLFFPVVPLVWRASLGGLMLGRRGGRPALLRRSADRHAFAVHFRLWTDIELYNTNIMKTINYVCIFVSSENFLKCMGYFLSLFIICMRKSHWTLYDGLHKQSLGTNMFFTHCHRNSETDLARIWNRDRLYSRLTHIGCWKLMRLQIIPMCVKNITYTCNYTSIPTFSSLALVCGDPVPLLVVLSSFSWESVLVVPWKIKGKLKWPNSI